MQKYFVNIFQGYPFKTFSQFFLKIFFLEPKICLFSLKSFLAFLVSKTNIFIHIKKTCIKSRCPLRMQFFLRAPLTREVLLYLKHEYTQSSSDGGDGAKTPSYVRRGYVLISTIKYSFIHSNMIITPHRKNNPNCLIRQVDIFCGYLNDTTLRISSQVDLSYRTYRSTWTGCFYKSNPVPGYIQWKQWSRPRELSPSVLEISTAYVPTNTQIHHINLKIHQYSILTCTYIHKYSINTLVQHMNLQIHKDSI